MSGEILTRGRDLKDSLIGTEAPYDADTVRLLCDEIERLQAAGRKAVHRAEEAETALLYERARSGGDGPSEAERLTRYRAAALPQVIAFRCKDIGYPTGSFDPLGTQSVGSTVANEVEAWAHAMLRAEKGPRQ